MREIYAFVKKKKKSSPKLTRQRLTGAPAMSMAILARLGVNIAANIGFQYAAEMLPTVVRAQGVSLIHIIGYFAHIIGPYVVYLVSFRHCRSASLMHFDTFADSLYYTKNRLFIPRPTRIHPCRWSCSAPCLCSTPR